MLERLDDVNWASMNHAYGSAEDVPDMLRDLASDNPEAREGALHEAYGNIFHQGSRYEATSAAVPFILEILNDPDYTGHAELLHLLTHLVMGYSEAYVPFGFGPAIASMREELAELRARPDDERAADEGDELGWGTDEEWLGWMVDIVDEARKGVPRCMRLLTADDEYVRLGALFLLSFLPEDFDTFGPAVWEVASSDESDTVRANALVTLAFASNPDQFEDYVDEIEAMLTDGEPIVRFGAALALGTRVVDSPDAVIQVLLDGVARAGNEDEEDEDEREDWEFLWCDGDFGTHAGSVLAVLCQDEPGRVVNAVGDALSGMGTIQAYSASSVVIQLLFPDGYDAEDASELDDLQRQFLGTLSKVRNPWFFEEGSFGNMRLMMSDYGLPGSMEQLEEFLG